MNAPAQFRKCGCSAGAVLPIELPEDFRSTSKKGDGVHTCRSSPPDFHARSETVPGEGQRWGVDHFQLLDSGKDSIFFHQMVSLAQKGSVLALDRRVSAWESERPQLIARSRTGEPATGYAQCMEGSNAVVCYSFGVRWWATPQRRGSGPDISNSKERVIPGFAPPV